MKIIDQGIEILTGVKAGTRRSEGAFEEGTINYRVDKRLMEMVERLRESPELRAQFRNNLYIELSNFQMKE